MPHLLAERRWAAPSLPALRRPRKAQGDHHPKPLPNKDHVTVCFRTEEGMATATTPQQAWHPWSPW